MCLIYSIILRNSALRQECYELCYPDGIFYNRLPLCVLPTSTITSQSLGLRTVYSFDVRGKNETHTIKVVWFNIITLVKFSREVGREKFFKTIIKKKNQLVVYFGTESDRKKSRREKSQRKTSLRMLRDKSSKIWTAVRVRNRREDRLLPTSLGLLI